MTKRRPGIFDPWRAEPAPMTETPEPVEVSPEAPQGRLLPARFAGKKAGVVVWLPPTGTVEGRTAQAKVNIVTALKTLLKDPDLKPIFSKRKIALSPVELDIPFITLEGAPPLYVEGAYEVALASIALAFREAARHKKHEQYILSLGIRAYVA